MILLKCFPQNLKKWTQVFMNTGKLPMGISEEIILKVAEFTTKVYAKKFKKVKTVGDTCWSMYFNYLKKVKI